MLGEKSPFPGRDLRLDPGISTRAARGVRAYTVARRRADPKAPPGRFAPGQAGRPAPPRPLKRLPCQAAARRPSPGLGRAAPAGPPPRRRLRKRLASSATTPEARAAAGVAAAPPPPADLPGPGQARPEPRVGSRRRPAPRFASRSMPGRAAPPGSVHRPRPGTRSPRQPPTPRLWRRRWPARPSDLGSTEG
jgi:hypothetical protein